MKLSIYTRSNSPLTKEFWKWVGRFVTSKYTGPQAVKDSLIRGLKETRVSYQLNPIFSSSEIVIVLSGPTALRKAITKKNRGEIKKLIAGPNVVTTPDEYTKLIQDPAIDLILVPSQWVKDYYQKTAPEVSHKVRIWASGVAEAKSSTRDGQVIIFAKDENNLSKTLKVTEEIGTPTTVFTYGNFNHKQYLQALESASAMIYISKSESQGLALQEAWMHNVPTFVHFTGITRNPLFTWQDDKINAPYLNEKFGALYKNLNELKELLKSASKYQPRFKCIKELSDQASVAKLLNLIQEI